MSLSSAGMALGAIGLAIIVVSAVWAAIRVVALRRHVTRLTGTRAFRALDQLPAYVERIDRAIERLKLLSARLRVIGEALLCASEAGARFAAEVGTVAGATEDLLDALVPSMRGSMIP
jgi:hypothetical protein